VLEKSGFSILEAASKKEALELVRVMREKKVVAWILDANFTANAHADSEGIEIAAAIKKEDPSVVILGMSGYSAEGSNFGPACDCFMQKPIMPAELVENLQRLLAFRAHGS
jgi:DNA-binding response OmpR family regulator